MIPCQNRDIIFHEEPMDLDLNLSAGHIRTRFTTYYVYYDRTQVECTGNYKL
jgi:hypothetical protein